MSIIERIIKLLTEYGNSLLSYMVELDNGDQLSCDPERGLVWYSTLEHGNVADGYTVETINEWNENEQMKILRWVAAIADYEAMKEYEKAKNEAFEKFKKERMNIISLCMAEPSGKKSPDTDSSINEDAINDASDGSKPYIVGFGINCTYIVYADSSDDAIDIAFDYAAEHDPHFLDDDECNRLIQEEKAKGTDLDTIWSIIDDKYYSGGFLDIHYVNRECFTIKKYNETEEES